MKSGMKSIAVATILVIAGTGVIRAGDVRATNEDITILQQCFEAVGDNNASLKPGQQPASRRQCIGAASTKCMDNPIGASTFGMVECISRETSWWDDLLNSYYGSLKESLSTPQFGALREVQRKWIAYKDAACQFEYDSWDGGSIRQPATASCFLDITAARTLKLGELVERASR